MTEPCAECGGDGALDGVNGVVDCDWCDGTGEVAAEELAPPSPPERWEVTVTRKDAEMRYANIVHYDVVEDCYFMVSEQGTKWMVPMSPDIVEIRTMPS